MIFVKYLFRSDASILHFDNLEIHMVGWVVFRKQYHFVAQLASQNLQDPGQVGFQVGPECRNKSQVIEVTNGFCKQFKQLQYAEPCGSPRWLWSRRFKKTIFSGFQLEQVILDTKKIFSSLGGLELFPLERPFGASKMVGNH